ncbi:unnamed protein product [Arctia plantaginis]|uniref:Uncharacterized protein n=1 Tax=Arctia plantaginis TaxID=874455 RepID=A0A8S1BQ63_ARCPL|nr:unnamed protein product [Arctia plantaginis]
MRRKEKAGILLNDLEEKLPVLGVDKMKAHDANIDDTTELTNNKPRISFLGYTWSRATGTACGPPLVGGLLREFRTEKKRVDFKRYSDEWGLNAHLLTAYYTPDMVI